MKWRTDPETNHQGFANSQPLRSDLSENNVQIGDYPEAERERDSMNNRFRSHSKIHQHWTNHLGQVRFTDPSKRQTRERDPELGRGKISIQMRRHTPRQLHLLVFRLEGIQLTGPDFDQRKFGGDKEAVEENQQQNDQQIE